jgi:hypothetical protein
MPTKNIVNPFAGNNILDTVHDLHGQVTILQGNKKADTEAINGLVVEQYAQLIPAAISVGVRVTTKKVDGVDIKKGKMAGGSGQIDIFKDALRTDGGYADAVLKKRYENTIKAIVSFGWDKNASNLTADGVKAAFKDAGVTSEAKLAAHVKQGKVVGDMEALAQRLFGKHNHEGGFNASKFGEEDWAEFDNQYRTYKAARVEADKSAAEQKAKVSEENEVVDAVVDQF